MGDRFRLILLGGFRLVSPTGDAISVSQRKGMGLLAYLGTAKENATTREALASLLWGQSEQRLARQSLRQVLQTLTKDLTQRGAELISLDRQLVTLSTDKIDTDTADLEALASQGQRDALDRASKLYGGEFLAGLSTNSPDFEDWLHRSREKFRDLALRVTVSLMEQCGAAGEADQAIEAAKRALHIDPFREDVHRYLMGIYAERGMRAAALAQYRGCADLLWRELGVSPDEETTRLHDSIIAHGAAKRRTGMEEQAPDPEATVRRDAAPTFLGMRREFNALRRHAEGAGDSGARVVLLTGEAGAGKSALLTALRQELANRSTVFVSACAHPAGRRMNFSVWFDLLGCPPWGCAGESIENVSLVRRLAALHGGQGAGQHGNRRSQPDSHNVFRAVVDIVRDGAMDGSLTVAIEDVQHVDEASMRLLAYVVRQVRDAEVRFVLTVRPEDLTGRDEVNKILDDLDRDGLIDRLPVRPLGRVDVEKLVRTLRNRRNLPMPPRKRLREIWMLSDGNPKLVVEMAYETRERGSVPKSLELPRTLVAELARRSQGLGEDARLMAATASVIGEKPDYDLLVHATGLAEEPAVRAAETLISTGLFVACGDDVHFSHGRYRVAQYRSLLPARRRRLHLAVASAMGNDWHGDPIAHYTLLLRQYEAASSRAGVLRCHLELGKIYRSRGADDQARQALHRALQIVPSSADAAAIDDTMVDVRLQLAQIEESAGQLGAALSMLRALGPRRHGNTNAALEAQVLTLFARLNGALGNESLAQSYIRRAVDATDGAEDFLWMWPDRILEHIHFARGGDIANAASSKGGREKNYSLSSATEKVESLAAESLVHAAGGRRAQALAQAQAAIDAATDLGSGGLVASALQTRGIAGTWIDSSDQALADLDKAFELAVVCGDDLRVYQVRAHRGHALVRAGRYAEAVTELDLALEMARSMTLRFTHPLCLAWKAWALAEMGEIDALELTQSAMTLASAANRPWAHSVGLRAMALALAHPRRSDLIAAKRAIRMAVTEQRTMGLAFERPQSLLIYARILAMSGDSYKSTGVMELAQSLFKQMKTTIDRTAGRGLSHAPYVPQWVGR